MVSRNARLVRRLVSSCVSFAFVEVVIESARQAAQLSGEWERDSDVVVRSGYVVAKKKRRSVE